MAQPCDAEGDLECFSAEHEARGQLDPSPNYNAARLPPAPRLLYGLSPLAVPRPGYWPPAVQLCGFWQPRPGLLDPPKATPGLLDPPRATPGLLDPPRATPGLLDPPTATPGLLDPPGATPGLLDPPGAAPNHCGAPARPAAGSSLHAASPEGGQAAGDGVGAACHDVRPGAAAEPLLPWRRELLRLWPLAGDAGQGPEQPASGARSASDAERAAAAGGSGAGQKPVCFDFGSMAALGLLGEEARAVAALRGALAALRMHGVLLTGVPASFTSYCAPGSIELLCRGRLDVVASC